MQHPELNIGKWLHECRICGTFTMEYQSKSLFKMFIRQLVSPSTEQPYLNAFISFILCTILYHTFLCNTTLCNTFLPQGTPLHPPCASLRSSTSHQGDLSDRRHRLHRPQGRHHRGGSEMVRVAKTFALSGIRKPRMGACGWQTAYAGATMQKVGASC